MSAANKLYILSIDPDSGYTSFNDIVVGVMDDPKFAKMYPIITNQNLLQELIRFIESPPKKIKGIGIANGEVFKKENGRQISGSHHYWGVLEEDGTYNLYKKFKGGSLNGEAYLILRIQDESYCTTKFILEYAKRMGDMPRIRDVEDYFSREKILVSRDRIQIILNHCHDAVSIINKKTNIDYDVKNLSSTSPKQGQRNPSSNKATTTVVRQLPKQNESSHMVVSVNNTSGTESSKRLTKSVISNAMPLESAIMPVISEPQQQPDTMNLPRNFKMTTTAKSAWSFTSPLNIERLGHAATVLNNGSVLVTGGEDNSKEPTNAVGLFDLLTEKWTSAMGMHFPRAAHTSSLLPDGKVLVAGGIQATASFPPNAELYDPITDSWTQTDSMHDIRFFHTASVLRNGKVIVTGGQNDDLQAVDTCELYDHSTGKWSKTGSMHAIRVFHTATALPNGKVLVTGGLDYNGVNSAELYDPLTENWTTAANMNIERFHHTASLLMNGQVLITGGLGNSDLRAELYNPLTDIWTITGSTQYLRVYHTASLLPNGKVLVAGGVNGDGNGLNSSELYDPITGNWTEADDMPVGLLLHAASVLKNGNVLISGGSEGMRTPSNISMLYNSSMETFISSNDMGNQKSSHKISMSINENISAIDEDNLKTINDKQMHW